MGFSKHAALQTISSKVSECAVRLTPAANDRGGASTLMDVPFRNIPRRLGTRLLKQDGMRKRSPEACARSEFSTCHWESSSELEVFAGMTTESTFIEFVSSFFHPRFAVTDNIAK
jgi:hypothetical protein